MSTLPIRSVETDGWGRVSIVLAMHFDPYTGEIVADTDATPWQMPDALRLRIISQIDKVLKDFDKPRKRK